jgi:hypothetical protein
MERVQSSFQSQLHSSLAGGKSKQGGVDAGGALLPAVTDPLL